MDAAKARGVKFGRPTPDAVKVTLNLRTVKHLIDSEGLGVDEMLPGPSDGLGNVLPPPFGSWSLVNPNPRRVLLRPYSETRSPAPCR